MSDDDGCAFDNWQEAAEQLEKQQLQQKPQQTLAQNETQSNQIPDALNQQQKAQKVPIDPKQVLKKKLELYQEMTLEDFQATQTQINENNKIVAKKVGNPVLKSDKDFNNYARSLAKRFDSIVQNEEATIDDQKLSLFFEELTMYMYRNLQWKNLYQVLNKLKVLKKQRKTDQEKRRKRKEKQERVKKLQGQSEQKSQSQAQSKKQKKQQEDLFGGATTINSKQQEQQRKNKIIVEENKKQEKKEDSDDDFM